MIVSLSLSAIACLESAAFQAHLPLRGKEVLVRHIAAAIEAEQCRLADLAGMGLYKQ